MTIPKEVRDALGLRGGDRLYFLVHDDDALISKVVDFLDLAGSVPVPPELRGKSWKEIRQETWRRGRDTGEPSKRS